MCCAVRAIGCASFLSASFALSYPNGAVASYAYDAIGRLTSLTHKTSTGATIASFSYTHDAVGNRLTRTADSITGAYLYDKVYRLMGAAYTGSGPTNLKDESFTYDKVGNRLTSTPNRIYTYNAGDELTSYRGKVYSYDNNGNLIRKTDDDVDVDLELEGWTYYYDYDNRLMKAIKSEKNEVKTITFKYDPFGRRVEKKVEGADKGVTETKTYTYVYDNEDIVSEYDAGGNLTSRYIHGPGIDEPLALKTGGVVYYYHADGLGSVVALTDGTGKAAQSYEYDAFGGLHDKMNAVKQPYTFTGREYDRETGLYYYRARYYDAETGRFISRDPIGFAGGVNIYLYIDNDPINYTDLSGLKSKKYWVPPDLNLPSTTPTPDTDSIDYPYAPLKSTTQNSCAVCSPTFHANVYWSCVGYQVLNYIPEYTFTIGLMLTPSGFSQAVGTGSAIALSNYIGLTCRSAATYCD